MLYESLNGYSRKFNRQIYKNIFPVHFERASVLVIYKIQEGWSVRNEREIWYKNWDVEVLSPPFKFLITHPLWFCDHLSCPRDHLLCLRDHLLCSSHHILCSRDQLFTLQILQVFVAILLNSRDPPIRNFWCDQ